MKPSLVAQQQTDHTNKQLLKGLNLCLCFFVCVCPCGCSLRWKGLTFVALGIKSLLQIYTICMTKCCYGFWLAAYFLFIAYNTNFQANINIISLPTTSTWKLNSTYPYTVGEVGGFGQQNLVNKIICTVSWKQTFWQGNKKKLIITSDVTGNADFLFKASLPVYLWAGHPVHWLCITQIHRHFLKQWGRQTWLQVLVSLLARFYSQNHFLWPQWLRLKLATQLKPDMMRIKERR